MLDRRGNHVIARLDQAEQSQVVAFGAAAGKDNLGSATVQQLGNLLACPLHRRPRLLSLLMDGRGVPKLLEEVGTHRLKHFGQKRAGGVVVEIHPAHQYDSILSDYLLDSRRRSSPDSELIFPLGALPATACRSGVPSSCPRIYS